MTRKEYFENLFWPCCDCINKPRRFPPGSFQRSLFITDYKKKSKLRAHALRARPLLLLVSHPKCVTYVPEHLLPMSPSIHESPLSLQTRATQKCGEFIPASLVGRYSLADSRRHSYCFPSSVMPAKAGNHFQRPSAPASARTPSNDNITTKRSRLLTKSYWPGDTARLFMVLLIILLRQQ